MIREKVIYEKKFPKWDMQSDEDSAEVEIEVDEEKEHLTFEQIMEAIYKDVIYVFLPDRVEKAKAFIRKAVEVSELYEMDIKIEQRTSHISVTYYFDFGGGMKALTDIIGMADELAFFGRKDNAYDIVMSLDFYTHAVYRNGRQVEP